MAKAPYIIETFDMSETEAPVQTIRDIVNLRSLRVTPSTLYVSPGHKTALRVRSNCAWRLTFGVEGLTPSITSGFGDATIDINVAGDFDMPGSATFSTDDENVASVVDIRLFDNMPAGDI